MEAAIPTGFWQLTVIMVVIASQLLYRYVAPYGWKEWSRAGLVQGFIVALHAEMYGFFPLQGEWKRLLNETRPSGRVEP